MSQTPPPPNPAPNPGDVNASDAEGGIVRDVSSILANLNQEQLASIVAAARASGNSGEAESYSGLDAHSILAALPHNLGQAASALTSFASSFKRSNAGERGEDGTIEGQEGLDDDQQMQMEDDYKKDGENTEGQYEHHNMETGGDYSEAQEDTATAVAAMTSLQHTEHNQGSSTSQKVRTKKESGPEAERARKDQHKEVERKRRELISNGITELANIVPGCDVKGVNKTAIINAAVRYIQELKNNEASNIEKWTLEKLLMDQAMNDLNQHLEASRKEVARLRAELGIEGEPEESIYHQTGNHHHHEEVESQVDPDLNGTTREGAASALSEVAAAAAAAAAAATAAEAEEENSRLNGDASAEAADVEAALSEKKEVAPAPITTGRGKGRNRGEASNQKEESTTRSKRARH